MDLPKPPDLDLPAPTPAVPPPTPSTPSQNLDRSGQATPPVFKPTPTANVMPRPSVVMPARPVSSVVPPRTSAIPPSPVQSMPPKKRMGWFGKIFWTLFLLVLIGAGAFTYLYQDDVFKTSWSHRMNEIEANYNVSSKEFLTQFKTIDINVMLGASSTPVLNAELLAKVEAAKPLLIKLNTDVKEGLAKSQETVGTRDAAAKDLWGRCYIGRDKGVVLITKGLENTSKYIKAYSLQQDYATFHFPKFEVSFQKVVDDLKAKNMTALAADIPAARVDITTLKTDFEGTAELLGYNSFKEQARAYQLLSDGLDDLEASMPKKDMALLASSTAKWQEASAIMGSGVKEQGVLDLKNWLDEEMTANYQNGNAEIVGVKEACTLAETETAFSAENSPISVFMKTVRGI